jgi:glycosyltransferase involved in cell wall biosynthesis
MAELWFWQRIVSPHMAVLAAALARRGKRVVYVAEQALSKEREALGWQVPILPGVELRFARDADAVAQFAAEAPADAVHLCQGLRGNGLVALAQRQLRRHGARQWVVMETVVDAGLAGLVRRLLYRALFWRWWRSLQGVLAIGWRTPGWVVARGMPAERVFPFAYFLAEPDEAAPLQMDDDLRRPVRLLFVGRLVALKRLDLLIDALVEMQVVGGPAFMLDIVGDGPQRDVWQARARVLGDKVRWHGSLPMVEARRRMQQADCLVLPSAYDGWGAVISEALMAGTPVVCSDACGAASVVCASGVGGVFPAGDAGALRQILARVIAAGSQTEAARAALATWARCLGAQAGAAYLDQILQYAEGRASRPVPPWQPLSHDSKGEAACAG